MIEKVKIYNKEIYNVEDKEQFLDFIKDQKSLVIAGNARKVANEDQNYTAILNNNIVYPDGKAIVQFMKRRGVNSIKYPGYILWLDFIKKYQKEKSFYFLGASEQVISETIKKLKEEVPGVDIKKYRNGYFSDAEKQDIIAELQELKPDVIMVASVYPKQEFLMQELFDQYPALYIGLGGSFNVYTDRVKAVPSWWEKYLGYEAFFRILQDPKKIKMQVDNFKYLYLRLLNKL